MIYFDCPIPQSSSDEVYIVRASTDTPPAHVQTIVEIDGFTFDVQQRLERLVERIAERQRGREAILMGDDA